MSIVIERELRHQSIKTKRYSQTSRRQTSKRWAIFMQAAQTETGLAVAKSEARKHSH